MPTYYTSIRRLQAAPRSPRLRAAGLGAAEAVRILRQRVDDNLDYVRNDMGRVRDDLTLTISDRFTGFDERLAEIDESVQKVQGATAKADGEIEAIKNSYMTPAEATALVDDIFTT